MKNFIAITIATVILLTTSITTFGAEKKGVKKTEKKTVKKTVPVLTIDHFIGQSIKNNPTIQRIEREHAAQRFSIKRLAAIKDLYLSIKSEYSYIDPLEQNGISFGTERYNSYNFSVAAKKKFPTLLGMSASLELKYSGYKYDMATSPSTLKNTGISVALAVSIPLLSNFMGKIDQNDLAGMRLNLKMVEKLRKETYESFLTELYRAYFDWALLAKKVEIYRGIMYRALGLYGQMARKTRVGLANWAEVHLARQNHLRYKNLLMATTIQLEQQYLKIRSYMQGKAAKKSDKKISFKWQPQLLKNGKNAKAHLKPISNDSLRLVQLARLQQEVAKLSLSSAKSAAKPNLNLMLSVQKGTKGDSFSSAFSSLKKDTFYGGVEFSLPFSNTDKKNNARSKKETLQRAKANYKNAQIQTTSSLKILSNSIKRFEKLLAVSKTMVKTSNYRIGAVYRQFNLGRMALYHITDARDALANARINLLEQQIMLQRLVVEYQSLTDILFEKHSKLFR